MHLCFSVLLTPECKQRHRSARFSNRHLQLQLFNTPKMVVPCNSGEIEMDAAHAERTKTTVNLKQPINETKSLYLHTLRRKTLTSLLQGQ